MKQTHITLREQRLMAENDRLRSLVARLTASLDTDSEHIIRRLEKRIQALTEQRDNLVVEVNDLKERYEDHETTINILTGVIAGRYQHIRDESSIS